MIHICGIDIGLTGGFTRFEMDTSKNTFQCTESIPTPTHIEINYKKQKKKVLDIASILNFFQYHKFDHIVIEHVHAMPGNGNVSMFNFGKTYGSIYSLAHVHRETSIHTVEPTVWKKYFNLLKTEKKDATVLAKKYSSLITNSGKADSFLVGKFFIETQLLGKFDEKVT